MRRRLKRWPLLLAILMLSSCVSTLPEAIRKAPEGNVAVSTVQQEPTRYRGAAVRWGGNVVGIVNRQDSTVVEVVARPLERSGRPLERRNSNGRFLAEIDGFIDPKDLPADKLITVSGVVAETRRQKVGEFLYSYPVIEVSSYHAWAPRPDVPRYHYPPHHPYWGHPWHDPWYYSIHPHHHHW